VIGMATATILHEDEWGSILDRPDDDYLELRWYDATVDMEAEAFNAFLAGFADVLDVTQRKGALVDAIQFRMPMDRMSTGWRDEHIVPRYNAAGLRKFAFVMPSGMPAIGAEPSREGPADYPTAYFATRAEALVWLAG
jgi:hypothetical protein